MGVIRKPAYELTAILFSLHIKLLRSYSAGKGYYKNHSNLQTFHYNQAASRNLSILWQPKFVPKFQSHTN